MYTIDWFKYMNAFCLAFKFYVLLVFTDFVTFLCSDLLGFSTNKRRWKILMACSPINQSSQRHLKRSLIPLPFNNFIVSCPSKNVKTIGCSYWSCPTVIGHQKPILVAAGKSYYRKRRRMIRVIIVEFLRRLKFAIFLQNALLMMRRKTRGTDWRHYETCTFVGVKSFCPVTNGVELA